MNLIFQRVVYNMLAIKSLIIIPRLLSGIFQSYGIIQPLAIVLMINFQNDVKHLIWLELLQPEIHIFKYCQIDQGVMYLLVLMLFILQKVLLLILYFKMKDICYQTNRNNICAILIQFVGSYQRIYIPYLIQPFTLICALSFQQNLKQGVIIHLFFSFVTFIFIEIEYFLILLVSEEAITYKVSYLDKINITIFDLLSYFSKLSQIFFFVFASQYQYFLQFQLAFLIIHSGSEILNQLHNQIYIFKQQRYITYFLNSVVFLFALLRLVMIINFDTARLITILSIIYPLIIHVLLQIDTYFQNDYLYTFYENYAQKRLKQNLHHFYKFINNCKSDNIQNVFIQGLIYNKHRQYCVDPHCICQITLIMNNAQSANPISLKMMNSLIYSRIMDIFDLKNYVRSTYQIAIVNTSIKLELTVICGKLLFDCGYYWQSVQYFSTIVENQQVDSDLGVKIMAPKKRNQFSNLHIGEISNQRILFILQQAKKQIKVKFEYIQIENSENQVTLDVNSFLINELRLFESLNIIIQLLKQQNEYYQFLLSMKYNYNSLSYKIMDYGHKLIQTEKLLLVYFHQNPILRLKSLICYFYAQIQNNYLKAYHISNLATISDEKQFKFISRLSSSATQTGYVFLSVNEDMQNLTIEFNSPIFQNITDFEKNSKDFSILVPDFIKELHQHQVSNFLETGVGTYFRNFGHTFIRSHNGLIKQIQMCYDHCQILHQQKLVFVSFIQEIENNQQFILVANDKLVSLSNNFLVSVGFSQDKIDLIMKHYQFYNTPIQFIMPEFQTYASTELIQDRWEGEIINFFNPQKLFNLINYHLQDLQLVNQLWTRKENINRFCVDIIIIKRKVEGQAYFYIYIEKIKKIFGHSITFVSSQTQKLQYQDLSEDSIEMDLLDEDIQTKRIHILNIQPSQRQSQIFGTQRSILNRNETKEDNFLLQRVQGTQSEVSRRIDTHYQIQQQFYSEANILNNSIDSNLPVVQKSNNHINKLSQSSSHGFRGSKFFKKFEIIDNFMSKKTPNKLNKLLIIFLVLDFVFVLFSVFVFSLLQSDLTKFIKEIDLISFHASIMGPHDLFYSMRLTIQYYEDMLSLGLITHEFENGLNFFYYNHIKYGFAELESSFYKSMTNTYVKEFLNSYTINIYYFNSTLSTSLRECLLILLNYQFDFKIAMEIEDFSLENPYQIFDQANFALIHTVLENVTRQMHLESIHRSEEIQIKWNTIWIIFLIVSCILGLGCSMYYQIYIKQFDKIIGLSTLIKKQQLQEEIKKLSLLSQNIKENTNLLYHYNLDLEHFDQEQNNNKHQESTIIRAQTLNKYTNLFYLFIFLSTFCTYSTLINKNSSNYLSKYFDTSEFYKLIQDLKLSNLILFKEILMTPNQIDHMNQESIDSLYSYIEQSEKNILKFTQLIASFDETKYLVSTHFIDFLQLVLKDNLCDYIELEFQDFMDKYCNLSFEGSLQKGMINALGYELNLVKTEQAINNFTKREFYPLYENEGSQIIQRVFFNLSDQFKVGLLDITDVQINLSQILSISFLIFNGLICIIFIYYYKKHQIKEYQLFRRVICLIPQKILLYDNYFDRQFRQIILSQNFE